MPTSLGPAEIMVILLVALIVLGPSRLPEAGRQVGKALAEVRKWSQGFQDEIRNVVDPDNSPPSYAEPQPGYTPPLPVLPAETAPLPEAGAPPEAAASNGAPPAASNGAGPVTTGSHGLVEAPAPASVDSPAPAPASVDSPAPAPAPPANPDEPPAGEPPHI